MKAFSVRSILLAAVAMALGAVAPVAADAAPAPAWQIHIFAYPTRFSPGTVGDRADAPGYEIVAKNVGGQATSGEFTLSDQLPTGLEPSPAATPSGEYGPEHESIAMSCGVSAETVTCSGDEPVQPGQRVVVEIPLKVQSAPTVVSDAATIEGGGVVAASAVVQTPVDSASTPFDFLNTSAGAFGTSTASDGSTATQAGSHPFQLSVAMNLNALPAEYTGDSLHVPGGGVRRIEADLPQGMVVNPEATPKCTEAQLGSEAGCPSATQVGTVTLQTSISAGAPGFPTYPLYNMVAPPGVPGEFAFEVLETRVHLIGKLHGTDHYKLGAVVDSVPAQIGIMGAETTLWGDPSAEVHDAMRGKCALRGGFCPTERTGRAFLSLPSSCGGPISTALRIADWVGDAASDSYLSTDTQGNPVGIDGCNRLDFAPTLSAKPTTDLADSPGGLEFALHVPQSESAAGLAEANLKGVTVVLPEGLVVNPSAAAGLEACTPAQIGLESEAPQSCPSAAKLGTAQVSTPLLDHPLAGSIYIAKPYENPFDSLLALYLAIEDPRTGIVIKLAGRIEADPVSGRLSATFAENPELPFEDFNLSFFEGSRAALTTPLACGPYSTASALTPWSTPEGADAHPSDSFQIAASPAGACAGSEADAPSRPGFSSGTETPQAGDYSSFSLRVARSDGTQRITRIDTLLPQGLVARISGIPYCSEAQIAGAKAREAPDQGALEVASPSCPQASEVGTVDVGAGSGPTPLYVQGHAYLAGPYEGAPLSLAIITPAVAGPFDLGNVVTRVALRVDLETAQVHAVSDPLPTILDGIPLDVRSVEVKLDRSQFMLNPTSCEPMSITGTVGTAAGQDSGIDSRFQVGGCSALAFKPQVKLHLKGATKRTGHPSLKAVVTYPKKGSYANIARAQVGLPHALFLDNENLDKVCKQADLKAGTCPKGSIYGHAKAWTPLLEKPLEGPVYLGVGYGHKLPDIVADLNGQIRILLHGKVDTTKHDGIRNTFEVVPDAPVSRFVLQMKGGKHYSLIENHENLCRRTQKASARFVAQNGLVSQQHPKITISCKKKRKKHRSHSHRHG